MPEYSYFFVMRDFIPMLEQIGSVTILENPSQEADAHFRECQAADQHCLFLNFTAPQHFLDGLSCPTVHVFAWEFDTIPTESWLQDGRQDWRAALRTHASAITHSDYARTAIAKAMGKDFPVAVIPCPVWDKMKDARQNISRRSPMKSADIHFFGRLFDSKHIELFMNIGRFQNNRGVEEKKHNSDELSAIPATSRNASSRGLWKRMVALLSAKDTPTATTDTPNHPSPEETVVYVQERPNTLNLEGVVYTSIFNPLDGRKNWQDMISAFIWAHKAHANATLVIKTPKLDVHDFIEPLIEFLKRYQPFDCRIVVLKAYMDDDQLDALREATSYYVNTSYGEGQCLPLMEYLSAGIPAIAPATTALADYIDANIAFVVPAHAEPSAWQHDPRLSYRTLRYRVDWLALVDAFTQSHLQAENDQAAWRTMGVTAAERLQHHCSLRESELTMRRFLAQTLGWADIAVDDQPERQ